MKDEDIPGLGFTLLPSKDNMDPFPNVESTFVADGGLVYGWPEGDWISIEGDDGSRCGYLPRILNNLDASRRRKMTYRRVGPPSSKADGR